MKSILAALAMAAAIPAIAQSEAPRCTEPRQCEVMWQRAQEAVGLVSNMRIRMVTDNRIETYPPVKYSTVAAVATKVPVGDSGYEFRIRLECYRSTNCDGIRESGTRLFNQFMVDTRAP